MSTVDRLASKMPSIRDVDLTDVLTGNQVATIEPPPTIYQRVQWNRTGLVIPDDCTPDEWVAVGELIASAEGWLQMMIGDWIVGSKGKWGWGKIYEKAHEIFPKYTPDSLKNMASIADNVHPSLRNDKLDYSHCVVVSKLSTNEQVKWLTIAVNENLTVRELRARIADRPLVIPSSQQVKVKKDIDDRLRVFRSAALQVLVSDKEIDNEFYQKALLQIAELVGQIRKRRVIIRRNVVIDQDNQ